MSCRYYFFNLLHLFRHTCHPIKSARLPDCAPHVETFGLRDAKSAKKQHANDAEIVEIYV